MSKFLSEHPEKNLLSQRFSISQEDRKLFEYMYTAYDCELSRYSFRIRNAPVCREDFASMYSNPYLATMFILNDEGKKVGFCLLGFGENTHPETNYYIAEFYVLPEHRRSGIGTKAVLDLLSIFPGKYCYHVLKENMGAYMFWEEVKKTANVKEIELVDILGLRDCNFFGFSL